MVQLETTIPAPVPAPLMLLMPGCSTSHWGWGLGGEGSILPRCTPRPGSAPPSTADSGAVFPSWAPSGSPSSKDPGLVQTALHHAAEWPLLCPAVWVSGLGQRGATAVTGSLSFPGHSPRGKGESCLPRENSCCGSGSISAADLCRSLASGSPGIYMALGTGDGTLPSIRIMLAIKT